MAKVAVLVDLSFFLIRYRVHQCAKDEPVLATDAAKAVWNTACSHVNRKRDELHRILVYDCRPFDGKVHNPVTGRSIDFAKTDVFRFRMELHDSLLRMRKVALRLGELANHRRWVIRASATKGLLNGSLRLDQLCESDVVYDIEQKGVDIKMGIDIAAFSFKGLVDRIVLITGDSDFVPAAKLARREGLDVILDPLRAPVARSLNQHIDGLKTNWPRQSVRDAPAESTRLPAPAGE